MYKYLLCIFMVMGCSSGSFDIAAVEAEDSGCISNCTDAVNAESDSPETDSIVEDSVDSKAVSDTNVVVSDTDTVVDTMVADTKVTDTYVAPPPVDTGPTCVPKTCSSLLSSTGKQPCGVIADGCGGTVSCPTTCTNRKQSCGGSTGFTSFPVSLATTLLPKAPYQCAGDCAYITNSTAYTPAMCPSGKTEMWRCSNAFSLNPFTDCVAATNLMYPFTSTGPGTLWCCPSNLEIK